jgi:hypothetical protein
MEDMVEMDMNHVEMDRNDTGGMHMTFYTGCKASILFTGWHTTSCKDMLWSCIVVLVAAVVYEGIKALRDGLHQHLRRHYVHSEIERNVTPSDDVPMLSITSPGSGIYWCHHLLQTLLHFIQYGLGYMLMLVAMTFNVWLFLSVIVGAALGYFLLNFKRALLPTRGLAQDPCH